MSRELDDYEPGEDVTEEFEPTRRPAGIVVSVRLGAEDAEKLVELAEESGRTVSQVARQAIRAFVAFGGRRSESTEVTAESFFGLVLRTAAPGTPTEASQVIHVESQGPTPAEFAPA
jgi:hypothetical protein